MSEWTKSTHWTCRRRTFSVEVVHATTSDPLDEDDGGHRWFVTCYLYPLHPLFHEFTGTALRQPATQNIPLHTGPIGVPCLVYYHCDEVGKRCSVEVGSDYNHFEDTRFTNMATREEASEVFADAERLVKWLAAYGQSAGA